MYIGLLILFGVCVTALAMGASIYMEKNNMKITKTRCFTVRGQGDVATRVEEGVNNIIEHDSPGHDYRCVDVKLTYLSGDLLVVVMFEQR